MSYLNPLRLHFAGQFQAAVSTVNNDPVHFDNSRFKPQYQDLQTRSALNGWFNPRGDATWRLLGCKVTGAWMGPATPVPSADPVWTYLVADSDRNVAAKLVDLDPEQQLVSTVFGLEVRLCTATGATIMRGAFEPAPFTDIWSRAATPSGGDTDAGACYQSVLTDLDWLDIADSPFLTQLHQSAIDGQLSIKFNVDSFNLTFTSPDFMRGRITGTIAPAAADEPHQLILGRHLMTTSKPTAGFFTPMGEVNFCTARVDPVVKKIYLDLGNALPTTQAGGPVDLGPITLACVVQTQDGPSTVQIDTVLNHTYTDDAWYPTTAGVLELPAARTLTDDELAAVAANPLVLSAWPGGVATVAVSEPPGGEYVRADRFVFRMSPGDHAQTALYATQFGAPYASARIIVLFEPSQLQAQAGSPDLGPAPRVATPVDAIGYPALLTTDERGMAVLPLAASDPGNPRGYIDGQVYGLRPVLEDTVFSPSAPYPFNPSDFVSILVWDAFAPADDPVTWFGSLQPVLQQFENLYPVMKRFLRLGDYASVCANRRDLVYAFGLDVDNPNYMPVTRDLSPAKSAVLLAWLNNLGPDGQPLMGVAPPSAAHLADATDETEGTPEAGEPPLERPQGGKSAAVRRRLSVGRIDAVRPGSTTGGVR